jgi:hypothetical protein
MEFMADDATMDGIATAEVESEGVDVADVRTTNEAERQLEGTTECVRA